MTRFHLATLLALALCVALAMPALAADPIVTKRVVTNETGGSVIILSVFGTGRDVYGMTITCRGSEIDDIFAPYGWAGVCGGDKAVFATGDEPVSSGQSMNFRIVTTDRRADVDVTFRDLKSQIGERQRL